MECDVLVPPVNAEEGLQRLIAGNGRFLNGTARFPTIQKEIMTTLVSGQKPYATIIGCSDSRVPPELVFDAGFGELFVVRVAGHVLSPEIAASLEYAVFHLQTPLFVVLGHENCGAVQAALSAKFSNVRQTERIELLVQNILPCLDDIDGATTPTETLRHAVEANVRWTMRRIAESPEGRFFLAGGVHKLVGAIAELGTGKVRFLE